MSGIFANRYDLGDDQSRLEPVYCTNDKWELSWDLGVGMPIKLLISILKSMLIMIDEY